MDDEQIDNLGSNIAGRMIDEIYYQAKEAMPSSDPNFLNLQASITKHLKKYVMELDE